MAASFKRRVLVENWKAACRAPDAMDVSRCWASRVNCSLRVDNRSFAGFLELLSSHMVLVDGDGNVLVTIDLRTVRQIGVSREVTLARESFAEPPTLVATAILHIRTGAQVSVGCEGLAGCDAIQSVVLLWKFLLDEAPEPIPALLRSMHIADVIHAAAKLPMEIDAVIVTRTVGGGPAPMDKAAVIHIDESWKLRVMVRADGPQETGRNVSFDYHLDDLRLFTVDDTKGKMCMADGTQFVLDGLVSTASATARCTADFLQVFLVSAATALFRRLKVRRIVKTLSGDEVMHLYRHYCNIDIDSDGSISFSEFERCMGPVFAQEKPLMLALYALFDFGGAGQVGLQEYLYGFRVLLVGDVEDRLQYLFGFFDTKGKREISHAQFLDGIKKLAAVVPLKKPVNETIEAFARRLFNEMDYNMDLTIQYEEFAVSMTQNVGAADALRSIEAAVAISDHSFLPSNLISFGHSSWAQISFLLSGIQVAVSNPEAAKPVGPRSAAVKVAYNVLDGTVAPSSSTWRSTTSGEVYLCDYAPNIFSALREKFGVSNASYLAAVGINQLKANLLFGCLTSLYEMSSSGRSGSFFYASFDNQYIIKSIPAGEKDVLVKMLPAYLEHINRYPNTILTRFCGLHSLSMGRERKVYFVVMMNIFQAKLSIAETYDLKGSSVNRTTPMDKREEGVALKDEDFGSHRRINVTAEVKEALVSQIDADSGLLARHNLNDYSFLLGIHRIVGKLPDPPPRCPPPRHNIFQTFFGGIEGSDGKEVYFVGIIDVLTDYGLKKRGERLSKSVIYDPKKVSCTPPEDYRARFVDYLHQLLCAEPHHVGT